MDRFVAGFPQSSPEAVLAEGFNFQAAIAALHGLLDALFHNPGFEAQPILHSGNAIIVLSFHCYLPNLTLGLKPAAHGLNDIFYAETLGGIVIIDGQSVGHADGKRSRTTQGRNDFL
jgi:hypothetical protein